jgi:hypothetical protein
MRTSVMSPQDTSLIMRTSVMSPQDTSLSSVVLILSSAV